MNKFNNTGFKLSDNTKKTGVQFATEVALKIGVAFVTGWVINRKWFKKAIGETVEETSQNIEIEEVTEKEGSDE